MELYTTDSVPLAGSKTIGKAWIVAVSRSGKVEDALSALEEKAAEGGADVIIGVRIAATELPSQMSMGTRYSGQTWTAYGTAAKYA